MGDWLAVRPNENSLANKTAQRSIWYKNNVMPATKYMKERYQNCVDGANFKRT